MKSIRVFISSPGDVRVEREKAKWVVDRLDRRYLDQVDLKPLLWEDFGLDAGKSFQEGIDKILNTEGGVDIAVFILWSRFGSELANDIKKQDGASFRSGTEREFYFMLRAYEESGGIRPQILAYYRNDNDAFHESLKGKAPDQIKQAIDQFELAKRFVQEEFHDEKGRSVRAYHIYDEPITFANQLTTHLRNIVDRLLGEDATAGTWIESPYRGLDIFDVQHADIFHGRDQQIFELETLLRRRQRKGDPAFVVILGGSGSGKSSLARAGLAAKLTRFNLDDSVLEWRFASLLPGQDQNLIGALSRCLSAEGALPELNRPEIGTFVNELADQPQKLARVGLDEAAKKVGGKVNLLLIVDQLEELFTTEGISAEARASFLKEIQAMAADGRIWVIATLRSDFYGAAQREPLFLALKGDDGGYDLLPPGPAEIHRIIQEPARMAGVRFEIDPDTHRSVADEILQEATAGGGIPLPLLQDALRELYEQRTSDGRITFAAYQGLGGIRGALGRRAGSVVEQLPGDQRAALSSLFRDLVTVEAESERVVRQRVSKQQLTKTRTIDALVETLSSQNARLLVASGNDQEGTMTLAHETLIDVWPQLRDWIDANRKGLLDRSEAERAFQRWEKAGRRASLLLPQGPPLESAVDLARRFPHLLEEKPEVLDYIGISRRHHRVRLLVARCAAATVVAAGIGFLLYLDWQKDRERHLQEGKLAAEQSARSLVLTRKVQSMLQRRDIPEALLLAETGQRYAPGFRTRSATIQALGQVSPYLVASLPGAGPVVTQVTWNPDSRFVVAGDLEGTLTVWDAHDSKKAASFPPPSPGEGKISAVRSLHWSRVSELLTIYEHGFFAAFDPAKQQQLRAEQFAPDVRTAAFDPDGELFLAAQLTEGNVSVRSSAQPGKTQGNVLLRHVAGAANGESGIRAVAGESGELLVCGADKTWRAVSRTRTDPVISLAFRPGSTWMAAGASQGGIELMDPIRGTGLGFLPVSESVTSLSWHPSKPWLAAACGDGLLRLWKLNEIGSEGGGDLSRRTPWLELGGHKGASLSLAWSPDGARFASGGDDGTLKIWALQAKSLAFRRLGESPGTALRALSISANGKFVAAGSEDGTVFVWSLETQSLAGNPFRLRPGTIQSLAWHPTEPLLASGDAGGLVALTRWPEGRPVGKQGTHGDRVWNLRWLSDGETLVSASWDHTVGLWTKKGERKAQWEGHGDYVQGLAVSPDGKTVATGAVDGKIWLWDVASGASVHRWEGHGPGERVAVGALDYSPDGKWIVSGGNDGMVMLWNAATGERIQTWAGHEGEVETVAFSPEGSLIASAGDDGYVWIWQLGCPEALFHYPAHVSESGLGKSIAHLAWMTGPEQLVVTASEDGTVHFLPCSQEWWMNRIRSVTHRKLTPQEWESAVGKGVPFPKENPLGN